MRDAHRARTLHEPFVLPLPEMPTEASERPLVSDASAVAGSNLGRVADPYGIEARARFVAEPPKRAGRSPFERDRARIVHSSALRRLSPRRR